MKRRSETVRVLLVEDNGDDVELARRALRRCGLPVDLRVAEDGAIALELLAATPGDELPDLLLLDLKLPRLGGLELLARLRAAPATSLIPVVVLTTSLEEHDLREAYRHGANSYLRKPVDFDEFTVMIREIVHYWLTLNQPPPPAGD
jgi:two-component system response regulator